MGVSPDDDEQTTHIGQLEHSAGLKLHVVRLNFASDFVDGFRDEFCLVRFVGSKTANEILQRPFPHFGNVVVNG